MNRAFTNKISSTEEPLLMQSKTEESVAESEVYATGRNRPRSFDLYEEYRQCNIIEAMEIRRGKYSKADTEARRKLEEDVEREIEDFRAWLEETKKLEPTAAYYYAISLKGMLLGLPKGEQVSQLFDIILDRQAANTC